MIYLIDNQVHYKIGFTSNIENRLKKYTTESCDNQIIEYKPGSLRDELNLKNALKEFKHKGEWFDRNPKVLETFKNYVAESFDIDEFYKDYKAFLQRCIKNWDFRFLELDNYKISQFNQIFRDLKYLNLENKIDPRFKYIINYDMFVKDWDKESENSYEVYPGINLHASFKDILNNASNVLQKAKRIMQDELQLIISQINLIDVESSKTEIAGIQDFINRRFSYIQDIRKAKDMYNNSVDSTEELKKTYLEKLNN